MFELSPHYPSIPRLGFLGVFWASLGILARGRDFDATNLAERVLPLESSTFSMLCHSSVPLPKSIVGQNPWNVASCNNKLGQ
jgi:hypothetical protein